MVPILQKTQQETRNGILDGPFFLYETHRQVVISRFLTIEIISYFLTSVINYCLPYESDFNEGLLLDVCECLPWELRV